MVRTGEGVRTTARTEGLALAVVDRESLERLRSVRSLSGGETFLVSLALALSLAEMTGERAPLPESLFLDEGFGALDPDSLDVALAALDTLRASGRQGRDRHSRVRGRGALRSGARRGRSAWLGWAT